MKVFCLTYTNNSLSFSFNSLVTALRFGSASILSTSYAISAYRFDGNGIFISLQLNQFFGLVHSFGIISVSDFWLFDLHIICFCFSIGIHNLDSNIVYYMNELQAAVIRFQFEESIVLTVTIVAREIIIECRNRAIDGASHSRKSCG